MSKIKGTFYTVLALIIFIIVPVSIFTDAINWFFKAIKWILFIDNAETGLPFEAEIIIKVIAECIVVGTAIFLGINEKSPLLSIITIILGFALCILFYAICKYYVWILVILGLVIIGIVIYAIISRKKNKKKEIDRE